MPSNFLSPFLELDDEFCKGFRGIDLTDVASHPHRTVGFQRRHSMCPITLPNSKFNSTDSSPWTEHQWNLEQKAQLPRSSLNHIPFRVDRSISMIEGQVRCCESTLPPPPGLSISTTSLSSPKSISAPMSTRYKTELCRTYEESGTCKYGTKCQFAHGMDELRGLNRHPKYKTEPCRTFHTIGFCPYGARCHFIHNVEEMRGQKSARDRPQLRHSISFSGFSSHTLSGFQAVPDALSFSRSSSVSPPPSSPDPSPLFSDAVQLKHSYPFGVLGLQRSSSADSLCDPEDYSSSSSGCDSPGIEGRRLPIFSRLSVSDD